MTVLNGIRIPLIYFRHIKVSLPDFAFIYFNIPSTRIADVLEMYQMKRFIEMEWSPLSMFCF